MTHLTCDSPQFNLAKSSCEVSSDAYLSRTYPCIEWVERNDICARRIERFPIDREVKLIPRSDASTFNLALGIRLLNKHDCAESRRLREVNVARTQIYGDVIQFWISEVMRIPELWHTVWNRESRRNERWLILVAWN